MQVEMAMPANCISKFQITGILHSAKLQSIRPRMESGIGMHNPTGMDCVSLPAVRPVIDATTFSMRQQFQILGILDSSSIYGGVVSPETGKSAVKLKRNYVKKAKSLNPRGGGGG